MGKIAIRQKVRGIKTNNELNSIFDTYEILEE
jgi:hypothetical protein